jgi:regulatory protein
MKVTALKRQQRDPDRVNVWIDGKYRFSLDTSQVIETGIAVGREYDEEAITTLEAESQFGKLYMRALEYSLVRPRSRREVKDYLYRKTRDTRTKDGRVKKGVSPAITARVFDRLEEKGRLDDEAFARYWIENRRLRQGTSRRRLAAELAAKGVDRTLVEKMLEEGPRQDEDELRKVIAKKARRYDDPQKLMAYLARQGFSYDDIKAALSEDD